MRTALRSASRRLCSRAAALFDSAAYRPTRLPITEARTLPGHVFHSQRWHAAEVSNLLTPSWVLAGRADELSKPGSFMRLELPSDASVLIVRGKDMRVRKIAWAICTRMVMASNKVKW